ncbi:MAG: hypothetical protein KBE09_03385 [Candidatus Pacebacteria bacterium]|nr:hypothetical protein [Candidatus Paceibacterota bacterium]
MIRTVVMTICLQISSIHSVQVTPFMKPHVQAVVHGIEACILIGLEMVHGLNQDHVHSNVTCAAQTADEIYVTKVFGSPRGWRSMNNLDDDTGSVNRDGYNNGHGPTRTRAAALRRQEARMLR